MAGNNVSDEKSKLLELQQRKYIDDDSDSNIIGEDEIYPIVIRHHSTNSDRSLDKDLESQPSKIGALFFQCGFHYNRFIDEGSSFYQTRALWLLTNGKLPNSTRDSAITNPNSRKAVKIGICSVDELSQVTPTGSHSMCITDTSDYDSDCKVFLFVDNGPYPKDQAMQMFRDALAGYLQHNGSAVISIHGDGSSVSDITSLDDEIPRVILPNHQSLVDILPKARAKNINTDILGGEEVGGEDDGKVLKDPIEKHLKISSMTYKDNLLDTILDTLLNQVTNQEEIEILVLQLCLIWNRFEFSKRKIDPTRVERVSQSDKQALLLLAIAYQRVEFIKEFFHSPFSENKFTISELEILYGFGYMYGESRELLTKYYVNGYKEHDLTCEPAKRFYEMTHCKAIHIDDSRRAVGRFCRRLQRSKKFLPDISQNKPTHTVTELFLFSVLNGYHSLAMWLWDLNDEGCERLLLGSEMNQQLAMKATKGNCREMAKFFNKCCSDHKELACSFIKHSYELDPENSIKHMCRPSEILQTDELTTSCLDMASSIGCPNLISHESVQNLLGQVWMGPITKDLFMMEVLMALLFPPYLLSLQFLEKGQNTEFRTEFEENFANRETEVRIQPAKLNFFHKWLLLLQAPVTKFYLNLISYVIFLFFLSKVAIENRLGEFDAATWITVIYFTSFLTYEIRKIAQLDMTFKFKLKKHFSDWWHWLEIIIFSLYSVGISLKADKKNFVNLFFSFTAFFAIIRILKAFYAFRKLGPYIIMIIRMFKEMMIFLVILFVFILANGVAMTSILSPQELKIRTIVVNMIFLPFLNGLGQMELPINQTDPTLTSFNLVKHNNYDEAFAWCLLVFYMLISNVLLLNLLIAVFGGVYEEINNDSQVVWGFQRYQIVEEYVRRSSIISPFCIISDIYIFLRWCFSLCFRCAPQTKLHSISSLRAVLNDTDRQKLKKFELEVYDRVRREFQSKIEDQPAVNDERIDYLKVGLDKTRQDLISLEKKLDLQLQQVASRQIKLLELLSRKSDSE